MSGRKVVKLPRSKVRKSKEEREEEETDAMAAEWILKCGPETWERMQLEFIESIKGNIQRQLRKAEELRRKRGMPHNVVEMKPKK